MKPRRRAGRDLAYISATLKGAAETLPQEQRELALDCFEHYRRECEQIAPEAPERVAYTVHCIVDEKVQHMLATSEHGPHVTCSNGCASCCYLNVDVHRHEAALLWMVAKADGIAVDEARLARQAAANDVEKWRALPRDDRRCVFLADDLTCRVYEHRPGACRKYLVRTDPDRCDMDKYPGGEVGIVFSIEAEIVHSAALTVYGSGNMASMLLRTREKKS